MSDKTKEALEELKELRLALFRSAASLDYHIRGVELFLDDNACVEYKKMSIEMERTNRNDEIRVLGYDDILKKEKEVWQRLIDSLE